MEDNKTFTQEEVNTIVQDRLAKEKAKYEKQLEDMQTDVARREKRLDAQEKLKEKGLPAELVDLVNLNDEKSFNTSLELIERTYKQQQPQPQRKENHGSGQYAPRDGAASSGDPFREAMGL